MQMMTTVSMGDIYLIPDIATKFGNNVKSHPWIVKNIENNIAILCPSTTRVNNANKKQGIYFPAYSIFEFNRPTVVLIKIKRRFSCRNLNKYNYLGNIRWSLSASFKKNKKGKKIQNDNKLVCRSKSRLGNFVIKPGFTKMLVR